MGRPLIYICAVTVIVLGIMQINLNGRHLHLIERTSSYANESQMRNMAHSGVENVLYELRSDPTWRNGYLPYRVQLDYAAAYVTIQDSTQNINLASDQLRLVSSVPFKRDSVRVAYKVKVVIGQLPDIPGALTLTDSQFTTDLFGSFQIDGNDESGLDTTGIPGITVIDQASKDKIFADDPDHKFLDQVTGSTGTPSIEVDESIDFTDMEQLIDMLEPNAYFLEGNYTQDLGSPENPGVFFVEDYAKISGNVNGYGILVVKQTGNLDLTTLDLKGNFDFYGLVIFENSWAFDGAGTATIHGSVLVGSPEEASDLEIRLGGTLKILYNSWALQFANEAARRSIPASFLITDIFE